MNKKSLGKGLGALIPDNYSQQIENKEDTASGIAQILLSQIEVNRDQPREHFDPQKLADLKASIQSKGIIQPIVVTKKGDNRYEIVCGGRRFEAVKQLGLQSIPAIVKEVSADALLELALIENIQREDLNAIEEAKAYMRLQEAKHFSQEEIAQRVGKDRSTIANTIRLLRLPIEVQELITLDRLTNGHARALLALPTSDYQVRLASRIVKEGLSVRQTEEIVQRTSRKRRAKTARQLDAQIVDLERKLEQKLGTRVKLFAGKKRGRIEISYFSLDDLDRVLGILGIDVD